MRPERGPEQDSERARCVCGNPGFERDVWRGNTRGVRTTLSVAPSGRISFRTRPRAKALGYSVMPLRGNRPLRRIAHSPTRRFAQSDPEIFAHEVIKHPGR